METSRPETGTSTSDRRLTRMARRGLFRTSWLGSWTIEVAAWSWLAVVLITLGSAWLKNERFALSPPLLEARYKTVEIWTSGQVAADWPAGSDVSAPSRLVRFDPCFHPVRGILATILWSSTAALLLAAVRRARRFLHAGSSPHLFHEASLSALLGIATSTLWLGRILVIHGFAIYLLPAQAVATADGGAGAWLAERPSWHPFAFWGAALIAIGIGQVSAVAGVAWRAGEDFEEVAEETV